MNPTIRKEVWYNWIRVLEAPCSAKHLPFNCLDYGETSEGPGWEARPSGWCSEGLGWCLLLLTTHFIILVCPVYLPRGSKPKSLLELRLQGPEK